MDFAHGIAETGKNSLVLLDQAFAGKGVRDNHGLEVTFARPGMASRCTVHVAFIADFQVARGKSLGELLAKFSFNLHGSGCGSLG